MTSTDSAISVRVARRTDLAFTSRDGQVPPLLVAKKIDAAEVFVAQRGDERVGYMRLEHLWSQVPYIAIIWVQPEHRGLGVGQALLRHVEIRSAKRGCTALYSSSQADEAAPQAWHRRVGFTECGFLAGINEGGVGEVFFRKTISLTSHNFEPPIYHLARYADWSGSISQGDVYQPHSLSRDGFIHCSTAAQVGRIANHLYRGRQNLCLLVLDPAAISVEIRYENLESGQERFPHIYGVIPLSAVTAAHMLTPEPDGSFVLNELLV